MIVRLLEQLDAAGVERVVVVVGYGGNQVASTVTCHPGFGGQVAVVENRDWEQGLASSLMAARPHLSGDFVLAMADHVFDAQLIARVVTGESERGITFMAIDDRVDRVFDLCSAVKVRVDGGRVVELGQHLPGYHAVDAGLMVASDDLFDAVERVAADGDLTSALQIQADAGKVRAVDVGGCDWDDVDTPSGLVHAEMRLRRERRSGRAAIVAAGQVRPPRKADYLMIGPERAEILIGRGFIRDPGRLRLVPKASASSPIFVFTDETVNGLYGERFVAALRGEGRQIHLIKLVDGEESKTLANYAYLVERVLSRGVDERSVFISLRKP